MLRSNKVLINRLQFSKVVFCREYSPMSLPGEYRNQAAECLAAARGAENRGSKALYLMIANAWVRLADELDARESNVVPLRRAP
jgi:hypothetical protein